MGEQWFIGSCHKILQSPHISETCNVLVKCEVASSIWKNMH